MLQRPFHKRDSVKDAFFFRQFPGLVYHGLGNVEMCDLAAMFCKENRESPTSCAAVEHGPYSVQMRKQLLFNMAFLDDVIYEGLLTAAFQFPFVRQIPQTFRYFSAIIHKIPSFSGFGTGL